MELLAQSAVRAALLAQQEEICSGSADCLQQVRTDATPRLPRKLRLFPQASLTYLVYSLSITESNEYISHLGV